MDDLRVVRVRVREYVCARGRDVGGDSAFLLRALRYGGPRGRRYYERVFRRPGVVCSPAFRRKDVARAGVFVSGKWVSLKRKILLGVSSRMVWF